MAEPAPIYDPNDKEPVTGPDLRVLEGGAESSPPTGKLSAAPDESDLSQKESDPDRIGKGYTGGGSPGFSLRGLTRTRKRKLLIGVSLAAAIAAISITIFLVLLPLKVLHIMTNLQERFFATSDSASEKATDKLLHTYITKKVFPALTTCRSTINKDCRVLIPAGGNPVTALYRGWSQAKLENKLATQYGIEFEWERGNKYFIKTRGAPRTQLGSTFEFRTEWKKELRTALAAESRWKQTFVLYKANRMARVKTGLFPCMIACKTRYDFSDWKKDQKNKAYKFVMAHSVIGPRDEMFRLVIECTLTRSCDMARATGDQPDIGPDGNCRARCTEGGRPLNGLERKIRDSILNKPDGWNVNSATKLAAAEKLYDEIRTAGSLKGYYAEKVIAAAILKTFSGTGEKEAKEAAKVIAQRSAQALPVIGALAFVAQTADMFDYLAEHSAEIGYIINSSSMIATFQTFRVYADEMKSGNVDPTMVGSFFNALGSSPEADVGGTAQAEESPLFQALFSNSSGSDIAGLLLGGKAYAANSRYMCNDKDGKDIPLPAGQLVCPEERLDQVTSAQELRGKAQGIPGYGLLVSVGGAFNDIVGWIGNALCKILNPVCKILGSLFGFIGQIVSKAADYLGLLDFFKELFSNYFLPKNPITPDMSGGRAFNMAAAGADLLGNEMAHYTLGGVKLSQKQVNEIAQEQEEARLAEYKAQPFLARIFDRASKYSPISHLAMKIPANITKPGDALASLARNPLAKIFGSLGSLFNLGSGKASAALNPLNEDPFGVTQYGYLPNNPIFEEDMEEYYANNCMPTNDKTLAWNEVGKNNANDITGQPENPLDPSDKYHGTNPCLLIRAAVGSAGALFTDEVLTPEERAEKNATSSSGTDVSGSCSANGVVYSGQYSQDQLAKIFGNPGTQSSHPEMGANLTTVDFLGRSVQVNKLVAPCLTAVAQDIKAGGINYKINEIGCYRYDPDSPPANIGLKSYHTYGAACDINPATNPFVSGGTAPYDIPQAYINAFNRHGFKWGGEFNSIKDYMHFEWHGVNP